MTSVTANFFNSCPILTSDNYEIWVNRIKIAIGCSNCVLYMKENTTIESDGYSQDVDFVLECTGKFNSKDKLEPHLKNGAKKVIVSAPSKKSDKTIVYGVNENTIKKAPF